MDKMVIREMNENGKKAWFAGRKGNVSALPSYAIGIGFGVFITSIMGYAISQLQGTQTTGSTAYNITGFGLTGMTNLSSQYGLIGTIGGLAVVLSILGGIFIARR